MIPKNQNIIYVKNREIDKTKWDKCINSSPQNIIYAQSFWLDELCKWDALILNDYDAVMPLTWNRKYGFYYLYQPYFTKQIGVFGKKITSGLIQQFLSAIPSKFKLWDIDFIEKNINTESIAVPNLILKKRRNYLLPLNKNYKEIYDDYKRLAHRMLQKARKGDIEIVKGAPPSEVIAFYRANYTDDKKISEKIYNKLNSALIHAFKKNAVSTYLAKTKAGEIIAAYLILRDKKFVYSLIGGSNAKGKKSGAFYLLTDAAIKDNTPGDRIFRFEGSDKKGIAFFNSQFNPFPVHYFHLYLNKLPWPLKHLK